MWELICHHTYKWHGLATDLSVYNSHGQPGGLSAPDFRADGASLGSGAWQFHPNSRISIPTNPGWRPMVGLRVDITARLTTIASHRQMLIHGDHSFRIFTSDRYLYAAFHGSPKVYPDTDWDTVSTYKNGLQFPGYRLTLNKWARLQFEHDGLTTMRLLVDDQPVSTLHYVLSGVPGVGPKGICIGNAVDDGDQPFPGEIDEIRVWRLDPRRVRKQFLERPLDQEAIDCWTRYVQSVTAAFRRHPDCAKQLTAAIRGGLDRWLRAIVTQGPETRQRFEEVRERYAELWRQGRVDGPEMKKLIADWCTWLRLVQLDPCGGEAAEAIKQSECWRLIQRDLADLNCDPQAAALMALFQTECGCGEKFEDRPARESQPSAAD